MCQPNLAFYLPNENFPSCRSWCPATKPMPPATSGLVYVNGTDADGSPWPADREFWSGESITYGCIDPAEGVDASDSPTVTFECKSLSATANATYQTPIRLALSQLLGANDVALIERKTEEAYYNDLNRGDVDYAVVVLVPCLIGFLFLALAVFCCTRVDNPWCKYCSRNYSPVSAALNHKKQKG